MTVQDDVELDFQRPERIGLEEAILCGQKSPAQLAEILRRAEARAASLLLTRLPAEHVALLPEEQRARLDYDPESRTAFYGPVPALRPGRSRVAIVCAGTSDVAVAREAERTLRYSGEPSTFIADVGVAGLWRLQRRVDELRTYPIVIAVAGMDAALPTVLGGLVGAVVFGVPTSVGYGVSAGGHGALTSMLSSCTSGIAVLNIDNGYGAACAALRVLRSADKLQAS